MHNHIRQSQILDFCFTSHFASQRFWTDLNFSKTFRLKKFPKITTNVMHERKK